MIDIKLVNQDFSIREFDGADDSITYYDIEVEDEVTAIRHLVRRAVETPLGYIGRYVIDTNGISNLDGGFGDAIYSRLSEGLTVNLVSQIKQDIESAISFVSSEINLESVRVNVVSFDTIDVKVEYSLLGQPVQTIVTTLSL
jgi:hypothetical protein